jgi:16S rRNA (adenine1518-N6/adenine1519-N6)-dimethyltransferase
VRPKKSLGQHFLIDQRVLEKEAAWADVKGKRVLEIGAGEGALTRYIAKDAGHLALVEIDKGLCRILREKFGRRKNIRIVCGDILEEEELHNEHFDVVIGNIPYYITSDIVFLLAKMDFTRAILCVQLEFAEKMAALPGAKNYGRLSVTSQTYFEIELLDIVPPSAFSPPPKVHSAIIQLVRTGRGITGEDGGLIAAIFCHRRQSVRKAVFNSRVTLGISKEKAHDIGKRVKYAERKVFTLDVGEVALLCQSLRSLMRT